jgi:hypothetical protein
MTDDRHQVMAKAHIAFGKEVVQFMSKSEVLVALSVFSSPYFFHQ